MCKNCYHKVGRKKQAINCDHKNSSNYAKGLCKQCYQRLYSRVYILFI